MGRQKNRSFLIENRFRLQNSYLKNKNKETGYRVTLPQLFRLRVMRYHFQIFKNKSGYRFLYFKPRLKVNVFKKLTKGTMKFVITI